MLSALASRLASRAGLDTLMSQRGAARIPAERRLRSSLDFARLRERGRALRGSHCLLVTDSRPGEPTRVAFVASRKGVGDAVRRNRARRRLREIVRKRWPEIVDRGLCLMFVAFRSALTAPHPELSSDVDKLLERAGAIPQRLGA